MAHSSRLRPSLLSCLLRVFSLGLILGWVGCRGSVGVVVDLDQMLVIPVDPEERITYAREILRSDPVPVLRRRLDGLGGYSAFVGSTKEIDEPVEFCLDHLATLLEGGRAKKLNPTLRCHALVTSAEIARLDPTRVVRAQALRTCQALGTSLGVRFDSRESEVAEDEEEEEEIEQSIAALLETLAEGDESLASAMLSRRPEILACAALLTDLRPADPDFSTRLARLCVLTAWLADDDQIRTAYVEAAQQLALHSAFQASLQAIARGPISDTAEVLTNAVALMIAIDPRGASEVLAGAYTQIITPLARVAMLRTLHDGDTKAADLAPALRRYLLLELDSGNAAVQWWSQRTLARLLELDPEATSLEVVRQRWEELGGWEVAAESP